MKESTPCNGYLQETGNHLTLAKVDLSKLLLQTASSLVFVSVSLKHILQGSNICQF